jgi:4-aminobutyrate aminotransferase-like enzyme
MAGIELASPAGKPATATALAAIKRLLHRGYIFLPEGEHANVISFTPPLTITKAQLTRAVHALQKVLAE